MRYVIGRVWIRPGKREEFIRIVGDFVGASRKESGCLYYHLAAMPDDPNGLILAEGWASAETHGAHTASEHFKAFGTTFMSYLSRAVFEEMDVTDVNTLRFGDAA